MKFHFFGLVAMISLLGIGCTPEPKTESSDTTSKAEFKVALLTPGPVTDQGWNAMAYQGLMQIKTECGAEITNLQASDAQIVDSMRSLAQKGYSLVIGHGFEYNQSGVTVSSDFPNTVFVSSSGGQTTKNAGAFRFLLEEGFYVAGYTAGSLSKSGVVAMIGGPDVPSIRSTFKAFRAGAIAAKPSVRVIETFTGKNEDVAAAKQSTLAAIGQGADQVIHQANAAAMGVFEACKEKGIAAYGANLDQNNNPTGVVLASAVIVAGPAFVDLAKSVQTKTYEGTIKEYGMTVGSIDYVWNPQMSDKVPQDLKTKIEKLKEDIKSGLVKVPKDTF